MPEQNSRYRSGSSDTCVDAASRWYNKIICTELSIHPSTSLPISPDILHIPHVQHATTRALRRIRQTRTIGFLRYNLQIGSAHGLSVSDWGRLKGRVAVDFKLTRVKHTYVTNTKEYIMHLLEQGSGMSTVFGLDFFLTSKFSIAKCS